MKSTRLHFRKIYFKTSLLKEMRTFDSPFLLGYSVLTTLIMYTANDIYSIRTESEHNTLNVTGSINQ